MLIPGRATSSIALAWRAVRGHPLVRFPCVAIGWWWLRLGVRHSFVALARSTALVSPRLTSCSRLWLLVFLFVMAPLASAFDAFVVKDIKLEGLQRIAAGTVFNYLPVQVGDSFSSAQAPEAIRKLFATGFFQDVELSRDGDILVVRVLERPSINEVTIEGNREINSDQLKDALKQVGLAKGRTFDRSILDKVEQELQRQYYNRGNYGVAVKSEVKTLERNRVDVNIHVEEGDIARISRVSVIGNQAFSDSELLNRLQSGPRGAFALFSDSDQYSRQKLSADLETLKSYYLDRGYINFNVESTQVTITPDRRHVYVTINVSEGQSYTIKEVRVAGDLVVPENELMALIDVKPGEVFSRRKVTESANKINERLGTDGYAFANINPVPDIDNAKREIALTYYVNPGRRVYVRRINIVGNTRTQDEVLRREMRQMEGGWIATDKVNRSRVRLQRLGFFEEVNVETPPVPGVEDQVDVNFSVKERSAGSLQAGIGFSESQGFLVTASVSHNNFLGTGKRVTAEVNNSKVNTVYSFSYMNPYYTMDGVSRGFRAFYRNTDSGQARNTASYLADTYGGSMDFGIPLSEFNRASLGLGVEHTKLTIDPENPNTPDDYKDWVANNSDEFYAYKLNAGWSFDSRNKGIFPDEGFLHSINTEIALPGGGIEYYKLSYLTRSYWKIREGYSLLLRGDFGYGDSYGETNGLPFFERYFAGGVSTVRGFRSNTVGPKENGEAIGGAFKTVGSLELAFPVPFNPEAKSVRISAFYDLGAVYESYDEFDPSELRSSVGIGLQWLSPIGPMVFSLGHALREQPGDETEVFQFTLGATL